MPSRRAFLVLGIGLGSLIVPLIDFVGLHYGRSAFNPPGDPTP